MEVVYFKVYYQATIRVWPLTDSQIGRRCDVLKAVMCVWGRQEVGVRGRVGGVR